METLDCMQADLDKYAVITEKTTNIEVLCETNAELMINYKLD